MERGPDVAGDGVGHVGVEAADRPRCAESEPDSSTFFRPVAFKKRPPCRRPRAMAHLQTGQGRSARPSWRASSGVTGANLGRVVHAGSEAASDLGGELDRVGLVWLGRGIGAAAELLDPVGCVNRRGLSWSVRLWRCYRLTWVDTPRLSGSAHLCAWHVRIPLCRSSWSTRSPGRRSWDTSEQWAQLQVE